MPTKHFKCLILVILVARRAGGSGFKERSQEISSFEVLALQMLCFRHPRYKRGLGGGFDIS